MTRLGSAANDSLAMVAVNVILKHLRANEGLVSNLRSGLCTTAMALAPARCASVFRGSLADVDAYLLALHMLRCWRRGNIMEAGMNVL